MPKEKIAKGRGVKVEFAKTFGAAIAISAISSANPAVATAAAAHNLVAGQCGYFINVEGATPLDGQAIRVASPQGLTFALSNYKLPSLLEFISGDFIPATAWVTYSRSTSYAIGGGEASADDITTLIDEIDQQEAGSLSAQTFSLNALAEESNSEAMQILEDAALDQEYLLVRVTFKSGAQRLLRAQPSLPSEDLNVKEVGSGSITFIPKGRILRLAPIAASAPAPEEG